MALYVDSAYLDDIMQVVQSVPITGVTTNPTILLSAWERGQRLDPQSLLRSLLQRFEGAIFIQPGALIEEEMWQEIQNYLEIDQQRIIPKLPITRVGMRVALRLRTQGIHFSFTAVATVSQAYTAALAGADFIIPYYNRLSRSGVDASERVAQMAEILHNQHLPTRILAASIKSRAEAEEALLAGVHDLTVPPQVLLDMVKDPQSEQAVEKFAQDWEKMKEL